MGVGTIITLVSRTWEIVDTFHTVDRRTKAGMIALTPTIDVRPTAGSGLSCKL